MSEAASTSHGPRGSPPSTPAAPSSLLKRAYRSVKRVFSKIQLSVRDPEDAAVTVSLAHQVQDFQAVSAVFLGNSGWAICSDRNTNMYYFWNKRQNTVSWSCPPEFLPFWGNELVGIPVGPNFADSDNAELPDTFEVLQVDSAQQPFAQETGVTITRFESTAGGAGRDLSAEEHHGRQSRGVDETSDVLERASAPALHMLRSSGAALNGSPSTVAPREARGEHEDCEGLDNVGVFFYDDIPTTYGAPEGGQE